MPIFPEYIHTTAKLAVQCLLYFRTKICETLLQGLQIIG